MSDRRTRHLPPPKPTVRGPVGGKKLIVPVILEGYHEGYISMVVDEYVPAYYIEADDYSGDWYWVRRLRRYSRSINHGLCAECEEYWKRCPEKNDELLLGDR